MRTTGQERAGLSDPRASATVAPISAARLPMFEHHHHEE